MSANTRSTLTVRIDRRKLQLLLMVLPIVIIFAFALIDTIATNVLQSTPAGVDMPDAGTIELLAPLDDALKSYPLTAGELKIGLFSLQLPPPALDALPYDVREPLSNGTSVPVKKRWLWVPPGQKIVVARGDDGALTVDVPEGALWWKEFYIETDRGTFLIERRIIARVAKSSRNPEGWAFYSSHYLPENADTDEVIILDSMSDESARYMFQPHEWLPTQNETRHIEVRFEDARGVQHPYLFPGQIQCIACHGGSAGAYPNADDDPVFVFGLHPNNLTPESFTALVKRGWIANGDMLITPDDAAESGGDEDISIDALTSQVVGMLRNNCASCHNSSVYAAANFSAFIIDPNRAYTTDELVALLSVNGVMMQNAAPLLTPGHLEQSEIWLRINGLDGRRRMPPSEGGLPEVDPKVVNLLETWIVQLDQ